MNAKVSQKVPLEDIVQIAKDSHRFAQATHELLLNAIPPKEEKLAWGHDQNAVEELISLGKELARRAYYETPGERAYVLSNGEWKKIVESCKNNDFAIYLSQHGCGFSVYVYAYCVTEKKAKALLGFDSSQLPRSLIIKTRDKKYWDEHATLRALSQVTHTDRNKALIEKYHLNPLREDVTYYSYT